MAETKATAWYPADFESLWKAKHYREGNKEWKQLMFRKWQRQNLNGQSRSEAGAVETHRLADGEDDGQDGAKGGKFKTGIRT